MEALAVVGLASNILQFTEFIGKLFTAARELRGAYSGTTSEVQELATIYRSLNDFSQSFHRGDVSPSQSMPPSAFARDVIAAPHAKALQDLSNGSKAVCDELLHALEGMKMSDGRWKALSCFRTALKSVIGKQKLVDLERRLQRFQEAIASHYLPILSAQQQALMSVLNRLERDASRLKLKNAADISEVLEKLSSIEANIQPNAIRGELDDGLNVPGMAKPLVPDGQAQAQVSMNILVENMSEITLAHRTARDISRQQAVLESLSFPSRPVRHDSIPQAHARTFEWALRASPTRGKSETAEIFTIRKRLASWLLHGDGLFWVSGKAGAGKSTLMKFVADHAETKRLLQQWATPKQLALASHYFWSGGTSMQKSELGLLRTLLFEVFCTCPELIPEKCIERWTTTNTVGRGHLDGQVIEWTRSELKDTLQSIAADPSLKYRFCFFIDGIDEFEGDHEELSASLSALSTSPNFKLCLSSRPWNVFEDFFGCDENKKLYVHELTHNDIKSFTIDRLQEHALWSSRFDSKFKSAIIDEITSKAQGVFLWVYLVTNSLRKGMSNGDTKRDLHTRLRSLPTDLNKFFKHMLDLVDPIYERNMAHTLRIAINAKEPLHYLVVDMIDLDIEDPRSESDENWHDALSVDFDTVIVDQEEYSADLSRRRINARCGGLLCLSPSGFIEFLHRTVRDFLKLRDMSDHLKAKSSESFKPNVATLKAFSKVLGARPTNFSFNAWGPRELCRQALQYANDAWEEDMDITFGELEQNSQPRSEVSRDFRREILSSGIDGFACSILENNETFFYGLEFPALEIVLRQPVLTTRHFTIMRALIQTAVNDEITSPEFLQAKIQMAVYGVFFDQILQREVVQEEQDYYDDGDIITLPTYYDNDDILTRPTPKVHQNKLTLPYREFERTEVFAKEVLFLILHEDQELMVEQRVGELLSELQDPESITEIVKMEQLGTFVTVFDKVMALAREVGIDLYSGLKKALSSLPTQVRSAYAATSTYRKHGHQDLSRKRSLENDRDTLAVKRSRMR